MTALPLCGPPSYEYVSTGPWFVTHVDKQGRVKARTLHTFQGAVVAAWIMPSPRRLMIDGYGITVLGTDSTGDRPRMVGTRETMEQSLLMVREAPKMGLEHEAGMLEMIETVRSSNGTVT